MASKRPTASGRDTSPERKKLCSFSSSWIKEDFEVEFDNTNKSYSRSVLSGKDSDDRAFCKQCKVSFSVAHGGSYDVRRHFQSAGHNAACSLRRNSEIGGVWLWRQSCSEVR